MENAHLGSLIDKALKVQYSINIIITTLSYDSSNRVDVKLALYFTHCMFLFMITHIRVWLAIPKVQLQFAQPDLYVILQ